MSSQDDDMSTSGSEQHNSSPSSFQLPSSVAKPFDRQMLNCVIAVEMLCHCNECWYQDQVNVWRAAMLQHQPVQFHARGVRLPETCLSTLDADGWPRPVEPHRQRPQQTRGLSDMVSSELAFPSLSNSSVDWYRGWTEMNFCTRDASLNSDSLFDTNYGVLHTARLADELDFELDQEFDECFGTGHDLVDPFSGSRFFDYRPDQVLQFQRDAFHVHGIQPSPRSITPKSSALPCHIHKLNAQDTVLYKDAAAAAALRRIFDPELRTFDLFRNSVPVMPRGG